MTRETGWEPISSCLENLVVDTKIDDQDGTRNEQQLVRSGSLFFFPDKSMYVYYRPTHWRIPLAQKEAA